MQAEQAKQTSETQSPESVTLTSDMASSADLSLLQDPRFKPLLSQASQSADVDATFTTCAAGELWERGIWLVDRYYRPSILTAADNSPCPACCPPAARLLSAITVSSVGWLIAFTDALGLADLPTYRVVSEIIKPLTGKDNSYHPAVPLQLPPVRRFPATRYHICRQGEVSIHAAACDAALCWSCAVVYLTRLVWSLGRPCSGRV